MKNQLRTFLIRLTFIAVIGVAGFGVGFAGDQKNMGGWEIDSPYNRLYNANELDRIKGRIEDIKEVVPLPGMSPGVALVVRETPEDETILVHLCPTWHMDSKSTGLRKGDLVKIRGVWIEIGDNDAFAAAKITRGEDFVLKVRLTKDGKPFWVMDPYELAKEKAATE